MLIIVIATLVLQASSAAPTLETLKKGCDAGGARECYLLGNQYEDGAAGLPRDKAKAASLYEKSCSSGLGGACAYVGLMLIKGDGIPKDTARAIEFLKRGCDSGSGPACSNLGTLYETGDGVAKDVEKATSLYTAACESKQAEACSNAGAIFFDATGGRQDLARAVALFQKGCDLDSSTACYNFAHARRKGMGGPKDEAAALVLFKKACGLGDADACRATGGAKWRLAPCLHSYVSEHRTHLTHVALGSYRRRLGVGRGLACDADLDLKAAQQGIAAATFMALPYRGPSRTPFTRPGN